MAALPETLVELQLAGYIYKDVAKCKCGASIVWMETPKHANMPFSRKPAVEGEPKKLQPHWIDCPFRDEFSRRKKK